MEYRIKPVVTGALLLLAGFSEASFAATRAYSCNACTPTQVINKARSMGAGNHYIYDLPGNKLHLLEVECEPGGGGTVSCYPSETPPPAAAVNEFAQYRTAVSQNNWSENFVAHVSLNLPSGGPHGRDGLPTDRGSINAYDTLAFPQFNNNVQNALGDPGSYTGFWAILVNSISLANNPLISFNNLALTVFVDFEDGSQREYKLDLTSMTYQPVPDSAKDSHGNPIPTIDGHGSPGGDTHYHFTDPNHNSYDIRNLANRFNSTPPPYNSCNELLWDGRTLTCTGQITH